MSVCVSVCVSVCEGVEMDLIDHYWVAMENEGEGGGEESWRQSKKKQAQHVSHPSYNRNHTTRTLHKKRSSQTAQPNNLGLLNCKQLCIAGYVDCIALFSSTE